jgi:hypothetical protein
MDDTGFTERLRGIMSQCLEKREDGRFYATETGRHRLQQWCDNEDMNVNVVIKNGRYDLVEIDE